MGKGDRFYEIKLNSHNTERLSGLEAAENFERKNEKKKKITNSVDFSVRKNEALKNLVIKGLIDFDEKYSSSIKSIAIEQSTKVNLTTRFLNSMFSKVSIKRFVYDLIDVFIFLNEGIRNIYDKYKVDSCYLYQNLTDTDSTSVAFFYYYYLRFKKLR